MINHKVVFVSEGIVDREGFHTVSEYMDSGETQFVFILTETIGRDIRIKEKKKKRRKKESESH